MTDEYDGKENINDIIMTIAATGRFVVEEEQIGRVNGVMMSVMMNKL